MLTGQPPRVHRVLTYLLTVFACATSGIAGIIDPGHFAVSNDSPISKLNTSSIAAGIHTVVWDGRDGPGRDMASGIFSHRLQAADFSAVRKMAYLK